MSSVEELVAKQRDLAKQLKYFINNYYSKSKDKTHNQIRERLNKLIFYYNEFEDTKTLIKLKADENQTQSEMTKKWMKELIMAYNLVSKDYPQILLQTIKNKQWR